MRTSSILLCFAAALSTVLPVFAAPIDPVAVASDLLGSISPNADGSGLTFSNPGGPVGVPRDLPSVNSVNNNDGAGQVQDNGEEKLQSFPDIIVAVSSQLNGLSQKLGMLLLFCFMILSPECRYQVVSSVERLE